VSPLADMVFRLRPVLCLSTVYECPLPCTAAFYKQGSAERESQKLFSCGQLPWEFSGLNAVFVKAVVHLASEKNASFFQRKFTNLFSY